MKKHLILLLFLIASFCIVNAQNSVTYESISLSKEENAELSKMVKDYKVISFDPRQFIENCASGECSFKLEISDLMLEFSLKETQILSPNYWTAVNGMAITQHPITVKTYMGIVDGNPADYVRLTIGVDFFDGYIMKNSELYFIKPLKYLLPTNLPTNQFIFFNNLDVIYASEILDCDVYSIAKQPITEEIEMMESASAGCYIMEIATEADYEFYQIRGYSVSAANNSILSELNQVEGFYTSTLNINFIVTFQNVWTTSSDPYSSTGSGTNVLTELINYWQSNFTSIPRDFVHFFSGKTGHSVRGSAAVGSVGRLCEVGSGTYSFVAANITNINISKTTAHEIGHLLGVDGHVGSGCSYIMCTVPGGGVDNRNFQWSTASYNTISSWISNHNSCLYDLASVYITGTDPVCSTGSYSVQGLPSGSSVTTWTSNNPGLTMSYSTATRQNNYKGEATITAFGTLGSTGGCTYSVDKTVWVGQPTISNQKIDSYTYYAGYQICPGNHWASVVTNGTGASNASWTLQPWVPNYVGTNQLDFTFYSYLSSIVLTATSSNNCGTSSNYPFYLSKKTYGCGGYFLLIYPNPASSDIVIELIDSNTGKLFATQGIGITQVELMNDKMELLLVKKYTEPEKNRVNISLNDIAKGTAFVKVKVGDILYSERIVIDK